MIVAIGLVAVAVGTVEGVWVIHALLDVVEGAAVHEEDVEEAVLVVVQKADTAAFGLEDVVLLGASAHVLESDARLPGDVDENRQGRVGGQDPRWDQAGKGEGQRRGGSHCGLDAFSSVCRSLSMETRSADCPRAMAFSRASCMYLRASARFPDRA